MVWNIVSRAVWQIKPSYLILWPGYGLSAAMYSKRLWVMSAQTSISPDRPCLYLTVKQMLSGKMPLFFSFWSSFPLFPIKLIQLAWCPLVLVYFPFWCLLAVPRLWVEGGVSGPVGKESVSWILIISGASDWPQLLGSPRFLMDSCSVWAAFCC